MSAERIFSPSAPAPIGPYNQAVRCAGFIFCSGQIAIDPSAGKLIDGDVAAQTRQVMRNLDAVLTAAGTTFANVVKTTIFLVDMADFPIVNPIYGEPFAGGVAPARSTVAVAALPLGARVEIEAIAQI
ncbi:MAG: Rid family detoxifying hydrolase [Candidatus Velthaea sp.]|jgi:reactive intermediate/imine deaminase